MPNPVLACPLCAGVGRARHAHPFLGFACESCWGSGWRAAVWVRAVLGRGETILVVDDSLALRLAPVYHGVWLQVRHVRSSRCVVAAERNSEQIDLVITDLQIMRQWNRSAAELRKSMLSACRAHSQPNFNCPQKLRFEFEISEQAGPAKCCVYYPASQPQAV